LVEVFAPNLYRVITQLDAPFISVVNINAESTPFANHIGIDCRMPFITNQTVNKDFTVQPNWFVVGQFAESFALVCHRFSANITTATTLPIHAQSVFGYFFFHSVHYQSPE
jgi:hypothetical protein